MALGPNPLPLSPMGREPLKPAPTRHTKGNQYMNPNTRTLQAQITKARVEALNEAWPLSLAEHARGRYGTLPLLEAIPPTGSGADSVPLGSYIGLSGGTPSYGGRSRTCGVCLATTVEATCERCGAINTGHIAGDSVNGYHWVPAPWTGY